MAGIMFNAGQVAKSPLAVPGGRRAKKTHFTQAGNDKRAGWAYNAAGRPE
jgi:hypothetical protein